MSNRAEQAALKAYPTSTPPSYIDGHDMLRQEAFIKGYNQGFSEAFILIKDYIDKRSKEHDAIIESEDVSSVRAERCAWYKTTLCKFCIKAQAKASYC